MRALSIQIAERRVLSVLVLVYEHDWGKTMNEGSGQLAE